MRSPFTRIAIVGVGLIGGSMARAIERRWPGTPIMGIDRPERLDALRALEIVTRVEADLGAASGADLVVLAAPVARNLAILPRLAALDGSALITDTGSTKRAIVQAAAALPAPITFIGGHPMAGGTMSGAEAARADLFDGRPWLLTPAGADAAAVDRLRTFVEGLGARPRVMDAARHDHLLASVSHLPQLTASALLHVVGSAVGDEGLACAGAGLTDTTRLAASGADIWRDIATSNADEIGQALDALIATLQALRRDLHRGEQLARIFTSAAQWRSRLDRVR